MSDRQVYLSVDFARTTEDDLRRAALKRHLQFQSAGYVKSVTQPDQGTSNFGVVVALDGIVRLYLRMAPRKHRKELPALRDQSFTVESIER
jgi:hypothetical protein